MADVKARTYQSRFRLELRPSPVGRAYSAPQTPSWILRALLLREGRERGEKRKEESEGEKGREGKERVTCLTTLVTWK